jgi:hypothetical protein
MDPILKTFYRQDLQDLLDYFLSPKAIGVSRLSSPKPRKNPGNPVYPVKKRKIK